MQREIEPATIETDGNRLGAFDAVQADMLAVWHVYLGSRTARVVKASLDQQVSALMLEHLRACRNRRNPSPTGRT